MSAARGGGTLSGTGGVTFMSQTRLEICWWRNPLHGMLPVSISSRQQPSAHTSVAGETPPHCSGSKASGDM